MSQKEAWERYFEEMEKMKDVVREKNYRYKEILKSIEAENLFKDFTIMMEEEEAE